MFRSLVLAFLFGLWFVVSTTADDVGVTSARLMELQDGSYALEADVSPVQLAAFRPPVVPERFTLTGRPSHRRAGVTLILRYEFGGSDVPLGADDVLFLPWGRSAVLLTARWRDGQVHRAMFPRSAAGIRVPIESLRPVKHSRIAVAQRYFGAGFDQPVLMFLRLLLILGFVVAAGSNLRAVRLALVFAAGHGLSMVALELGVPGVPQPLAGALLGLGAALVARSVFRGDDVRLWPLALTLGLVDGLGIAESLSRAALRPGEIIPALFGAIAGINLVLIAAAVVLAALWRITRRPTTARSAAALTGFLAMAVALGSMATGLRAAGRLDIDRADQMTALRLDFAAGSTGRGSGAARAAAPRRLDDPAMVFLTVEPMEVRVEVLLSLLDFIQPLGIDANPRSVVPVEVQQTIAGRAKKMVTDTVSVVVDGREAIPLLARTDFVNVAATGVSTRQEPQPEPLDTAVLGVTLAYGVERPPSEISLRWQVFPKPETAIPAVWTDPTTSERSELTPERPVLTWANDLSGFAPPPVRAVQVDPPRWPLASLLLAVLAGVTFPIAGRRRLEWVIWIGLAVAIVLYPFVRGPIPGLSGWAPARTQTADVLDDLLTNVYRSFDLRDEEAIYDRLAVSVTGEQLTEVYLENRRALELENRGGARASIDEVEVLEVRSVRSDGEGGFLADATWNVSGSVNHFGHVHYRQNRYDAMIHLLAVDGAWKIRGIEILDERRVL